MLHLLSHLHLNKSRELHQIQGKIAPYPEITLYNYQYKYICVFVEINDAFVKPGIRQAQASMHAPGFLQLSLSRKSVCMCVCVCSPVWSLVCNIMCSGILFSLFSTVEPCTCTFLLSYVCV